MDELEKKILDLLKRQEVPLLIREIAKKLGSDPITVNRRLIALKERDEIRMKKYGTGKAYYI